jgi:hypothetical protein
MEDGNLTGHDPVLLFSLLLISMSLGVIRSQSFYELHTSAIWIDEQTSFFMV